MRTLNAYLDSRRVGTLGENNDLWAFEYDPEWAEAADGFDLSPRLTRSRRLHQDGATERPVQWYFDNLLPEEHLRDAVSKEARLSGDDAFGLLAYLGAESAGSLILLPPNEDIRRPGGLRPLSDEALSRRIRDLPRATLSHDAPKRMSLAGAQNKLLVVYRDGALYEPLGDEPSTHILKPDHVSDDYPASVANEYLVMSLAARLGLQVPRTWRRNVPEPVYIVERFDRRVSAAGRTQRLHIIDACQLLDRSRTFKYRTATLETLAEIVKHCRNRASTRIRLYQWLVFNLLVANGDNHLKNLSFNVSSEGIELSPTYDLLCTGAYHTRAFANERANWPAAELTIALPDAATFGAVTRRSILRAGEALGLPQQPSERELDRMARDMPQALDDVVAKIETEYTQLPETAQRYLGVERRLFSVIRYLVMPEMLRRVR